METSQQTRTPAGSTHKTITDIKQVEQTNTQIFLHTLRFIGLRDRINNSRPQNSNFGYQGFEKISSRIRQSKTVIFYSIQGWPIPIIIFFKFL